MSEHKTNLATSLSSALTNSVCMYCKRGDLESLRGELAKTKNANGIVDVIKMLNYTDRNGSTPLFHCAWKGDVKMINFMIDHGADPHWPNFRKNYPLDMAIETNSIKAVEAFLEHGAEITLDHWKDVKTRLGKRNGVTKDHVRAMERLLKRRGEDGIPLYMKDRRRPPAHSAEQKSDCGNVGFSKKSVSSTPELAKGAAGNAFGQVGVENPEDDDGMPDQHSDFAEKHMQYLPDEYKYKLWAIFNDCDIDSDLSLTVEEVASMNERLEPDTAKESCRSDAEDFMAYVDGDKSTGVSINEWTKAWERLVMNEGLSPLTEFIESYVAAIGDFGATV